jgi:hypothetical protein
VRLLLEAAGESGLGRVLSITHRDAAFERLLTRHARSVLSRSPGAFTTTQPAGLERTAGRVELRALRDGVREDGRFDTIVCLELPPPGLATELQGFIDGCVDQLVPGGVFFALALNANGLLRRIRRAWSRDEVAAAGRHEWALDRDEIGVVFEDAGLGAIVVRYVSLSTSWLDRALCVAPLARWSGALAVWGRRLP